MLKGRFTTLRALDKKDVPALHKWANNPEVTQYVDRYLPMTLEAEQEWFDRTLNEQDRVAFAITERKSGKLIGICELNRIKAKDRAATLGILVGEKRFWDKGYGTEAARLLLTYAFDEMGLRRISSYVFSFNRRSIRMHEKLGFRHEGVARESIYKHGKYQDIIMFGLLRDELRR